MSYYIRVWQPCDVESLAKHLLIVGDLTADCANCRELGIDYQKAKTCPSCKTDFHFMSPRFSGTSSANKRASVKKLKERRPDLTLVDYDDYKEVTGKQNARDIFG